MEFPQQEEKGAEKFNINEALVESILSSETLFSTKDHDDNDDGDDDVKNNSGGISYSPPQMETARTSLVLSEEIKVAEIHEFTADDVIDDSDEEWPLTYYGKFVHKRPTRLIDLFSQLLTHRGTMNTMDREVCRTTQ